MYVDLILHLALLVAISVVSGFIGQRWARHSAISAAAQGALFGAAALVGMLRPGVTAPGLIFDGRSVMISLCALFFGPVAAAVSALIAIAGRLWLGGEGTLTGVLVILSSALIGTLSYQRRRGIPTAPSVRELYLFGLAVHLAMLALMFTLPVGTREHILTQLTLPILLTFPIATILAGKILSDQETAARFVDALQRTRKDLDITLRSIGDAVASTDMDGRIVRMNAVAETLTGWSQSEARGRPFGEVFKMVNEQGTEADDLVSRVIRERPATGFTGHTLLVGRNGTTRPIAQSAAPIRDDDGTVTGVVLVVSDQTAQRAAQQALRDAQEQLQRAVSAADIGLWDRDLRTDRVYYSPEWKRLLGYEDDEISSDLSEWESRLHPDDRERVIQTAREYIRNSVSRGGTLDQEFRLRHKDGSYRHILTRGSTLFDDAGTPVRIVGSHVDITARVELQAQLLQAQKMDTVGRLAGGIAHDFNNLLTVINGTADLALVGLRENDPLRADLEQIKKAGDRAAALTRQLLAFSRKQILAPAVIDLKGLVGSMESMLLRLLGENVRLVFPPSTSSGAVLADAGQIEQVVMNLAVNARDAMPDGGTLTIEVDDVVVEQDSPDVNPPIKAGEYVRLSVSDTGTGMGEATRSRIFEPFFTTKDPGQGTGLGLSTVYGIVKQSGGSIRVSSEPGAGSTFQIYLPRTTRVARAIQAPAATSTAAGGESVLVVEDEDALRQLASRILRSAGYTVHTASDGAEALEVLEHQAGAVRLVLTDVVLPGMGGRELGARIKSRFPEVRILYTSGYTDDSDVREGMDSHPEHFIGKPYTKADLTRRVRSLLDEPRG